MQTLFLTALLLTIAPSNAPQPTELSDPALHNPELKSWQNIAVKLSNPQWSAPVMAHDGSGPNIACSTDALAPIEAPAKPACLPDMQDRP